MPSLPPSRTPHAEANKKKSSFRSCQVSNSLPLIWTIGFLTMGQKNHRMKRR
ncbi:hypothetical protein PILCRDRAFT_826871 [Piloderma croceum F 1598]|uniref:Uncharacterized protein n=1 Tax=Piloderma croceum (strain F 1598) TaxID=765440 RepID=A0A0C3BES6_PILCF|nr:hypothetical protein PILCRDRAFT_826871 [Piloderma croceum F 1598]